MPSQAPPFGIIGAFLVLLGAGFVIDADRTWSGTALMLAGGLCMATQWRRTRP
jgi:hypothetical protein